MCRQTAGCANGRLQHWNSTGLRPQGLLEALDNVKAMGVTKQVPHLRWSQAPPLPWRRPGSADILLYRFISFYVFFMWIQYLWYVMICYDMLCYVMTVIGCHRCLPMFGFSGQAETDYGRRRVKLMKSIHLHRNHHRSAGTVELLHRTPGMFCPGSGQSSVH